MANTEDYLDGLLDSITQAKEEERPVDRNTRNRNRREERRSRVRPDDDFMEATGLNSFRREQRMNRRERRHSEEDFLRSFEDELSMGDADALIRSFERELRSDAEDEFRLDDEIESSGADEDDDDFFAAGLLEEEEEKQSPADAVLSGIADIVSEAKRVATGGDDSLPEEADDIPIDMAEPSLAEDGEEPLMDIPSDISIGEDTSAQEVPLMDESGEGVDLMDMLAGEGEEDLMDIGDLLASDEEETELEEGREAFEAAAEGVAEGGEGVEGSEDSEGTSAEGASGGSGEAGEGGEGDEEAKPNIIQKILGAVTGIFKKKEGDEEDEDEDEEDDEDEDGDEEEGGETKEEKKARLKKEKEEAKKKKKEEADAKKKAKEEEKKKKAEEKKRKQAEKAAKPKKKKKPKERSPKIPIPVIIVFVLFALSIVGSVNIMTNVLGYQLQVSSANKAYEKKDYSDAYGILMGRSDLDGDAKKLRNRAKLMAYMQTKENEYLVCMDSGRETESGLKAYSIRSNYQMALDSLISGVYFFQANEEKANELGITEEYSEYGQELEKELDSKFNLTVGEAVELYRNNTRKDYTAALQKIIRQAGYEETY